MTVQDDVAPRRADVLRVLAAHRAQLEAMGVTSLAVFGSVARDEAGADSDVDILVDFDPTLSVGLFKFLELQEYLEGILGRKVDLGMPGALKPRMRDRILNEQIRAI